MVCVCRRSCKVHSTLWNVSLCEAELREDSVHDDYSLEEEEGRCRHITIHPDTLKTTAIVDHLVPCTQYLVRWCVDAYSIISSYLYYKISRHNRAQL